MQEYCDLCGLFLCFKLLDILKRFTEHFLTAVINSYMLTRSWLMEGLEYRHLNFLTITENCTLRSIGLHICPQQNVFNNQFFRSKSVETINFSMRSDDYL